MKKFNFDLGDVLEFRVFEQKRAEGELSRAIAREQNIINKMDTLRVRRKAVQDALRNSASLDDISNAAFFFDYVAEETENLKKELQAAKEVSAARREVLRACMQKTMAVENLRDSEFRSYKEEIAKSEDEERDDMTTGRFARKASL